MFTPSAQNPRVKTHPMFQYRRRLCLPRRILAEKTGVCIDRIYEIERGSVLPRARTVVKLSRGLANADPVRLGARIFAWHHGVRDPISSRTGSIKEESWATLGLPLARYMSLIAKSLMKDEDPFAVIRAPLLFRLAFDD